MISKAKDLPVRGQWEPDEKSFIKVRRAFFRHQHPLHPMFRGEKACAAYAWLDLVGMAQYADGQELQRGQLVASLDFLAARWNWSVSRVRKFLDDLESQGMIWKKRRGGTLPSVITIRSYDYYNGDERDWQ